LTIKTESDQKGEFMEISISIAAHVLSSVVWVGGMFFAYMVLRPAAGSLLDTPTLLKLWSGVFKRFFPWVWVCIGLLVITGYLMIFTVFGGMKGAGIHIHIMHGTAWLMILLFVHLNISPVKGLHQCVIIEDWEKGGQFLGSIRLIVGIDLIWGLFTAMIASAGKYFI